MFKNLKKRKAERKVCRSIKLLNRKLKTKFSYALLIEETNLLKKIPLKDDSTYLRYEHLSFVLDLLEKGLKEDFNNNSNKIGNDMFLDVLYDDVKKSYVDYLEVIEVLDGKDKLSKMELASDYITSYNRYTLFEKEEREKKIIEARELVESFKNRLKLASNPKFKDMANDKLTEVNYYGPMSHYKALKKIRGNEKKLIRKRKNPFNRYKLYSWYFFLRFMKKRQVKEIKKKFKDYFTNELSLEEIRLSIEEYRLSKLKENYDSYFDCFLWRLLNDGFYIYKKELGGLTRIIDLSKYKYKEKGLVNLKDKERIIVNVDEMDLVVDYTPDITKVNGGKSSNGALDIKELNEEINKNVQKEFINEQVRESVRKR